ncbi:FkbM family methyltransferase [Cupriavidus sp. PET2-C1]
MALTIRFEEDSFAIVFDELDRNIAPAVQREQTWEPWQLEMYRRTIRESWTCVDVGANVGVNAIAMSRRARKVYAFEPVELTHSLLLHNLALNASSNVTPYKFALGEDTSIATIYADRAELGRASIGTGAREAIAPASDPSLQVGGSVQVRPMDDWWDELQNPRIDFIKIDVEGFELQVLSGAKRLLKANSEVLLVCEMNVEAHAAREADREKSSSSASLFAQLRELFEHVFFMGRDLQLHELHSYSQLRVLLMHGHPVDDLFCCNCIPDTVADMIAKKWTVPNRLTCEYEVDQSSTVLFVNRFPDGWTAPVDGHGNTQSAAVITISRDAVVRLSLRPIYTKHAGPQTFRVNLYGNNDAFYFDVTDKPAELALRFQAGIHWIFIETDFALPAGPYLGNPQDGRTIGANVRLTIE